MTSRELRLVILIFNEAYSSHREVLQGIASFAETRPDWLLEYCYPWDREFQSAKQYPLAGFILHDNSESEAVARRWKKPCVRFRGGDGRSSNLPEVGLDNRAVGRCAAEYYLKRGWKHFAYLNYEGLPLDQRGQGFRDGLKDAGNEFSFFNGPRLQMQDWLSRQPKPLAVFAYNDLLAWQVRFSCRHLGLNVPDEVGIIGVDNDEFRCQPAEITSVALPYERIGYETARMLASQLDTGVHLENALLFPPLGCIERRSTLGPSTSDPLVDEALAYIKKNANSPFKVNDLAQSLSVSRRLIEMRFKAQTGRTLLEEIQRVRIESARRLLSQTHFGVTQAATRSGFSSTERFTRVFKRCTGELPSHFQARFSPKVRK